MTAGYDDWRCPPDVERLSVKAEATIRQTLRQYVETPTAGVQKWFRLTDAGGKGLRPRLVLLAASLGSSPVERDQLLRAAGAVEVLHVATLYHDDVIDNATLRRGRQTLNAEHGNAVAICVGALLFAIAARELSDLGTFAQRFGPIVTRELCAGELWELEGAFDVDIDASDYEQIAARKTSSLFIFAVLLGLSMSGGTSTQEDALEKYALHLGLAFQLADDALDFLGERDRLGKDVGADLRAGVYTLPVVVALGSAEHGGPLRRLLLDSQLDERSLDEVATRVIDAGGVADTLERARTHSALAVEALSAVSSNDACSALARLALLASSRSR